MTGAHECKQQSTKKCGLYTWHYVAAVAHGWFCSVIILAALPQGNFNGTAEVCYDSAVSLVNRLRSSSSTACSRDKDRQVAIYDDTDEYDVVAPLSH